MGATAELLRTLVTDYVTRDVQRELLLSCANLRTLPIHSRRVAMQLRRAQNDGLFDDACLAIVDDKVIYSGAGVECMKAYVLVCFMNNSYFYELAAHPASFFDDMFMLYNSNYDKLLDGVRKYVGRK